MTALSPARIAEIEALSRTPDATEDVWKQACERAFAIRDLLAERERYEWRPIEQLVQDGRPVQVWLSEPMLGSYVHTMRTGKPAVIGGIFAFDAPKPTHYCELPEPPHD